MKNMFKLAAIAVSMALVASLAACSSGDDDVVDASTAKYLVTAQIDQYVESITYDENVSEAEIESLETAHENLMKIIGDSEDCLKVYVDYLKGCLKPKFGEYLEGVYDPLSLKEVRSILKVLKWCNTKDKFNKVFDNICIYKNLASFVASIEYYQNVSEAEIKSLENAHEDLMKIIGDCGDCLKAYSGMLESVNSNTVNSDTVKYINRILGILKSYSKEDFHKVYVYKKNIETALSEVKNVKAEVEDIGRPTSYTGEKDSIVDGKLNERQLANMKKYTDAVAALKAALSDDDKKTCKMTIDAADKAFETYEKAKKVDRAEIEKVTEAVSAMSDDIYIKVCSKIIDKLEVTN